jgi:Xaa-Pro aminopeptidase
MSVYTERLTRLRAELDRRELDGILISQPESRFYLSGYTGHDLPPRDSAGYLLITKARAVLLTDPRTSEQAEREAVDYEVVAYPTRANAPAKIAEVSRSIGSRRLAFEPIHLPYSVWRDIGKHLDGSGVELVDAEAVVDKLRIVKDPVELRQLQAAVDVLDRCYAHVVRHLQPGMSERQVARAVETYLLEHADGAAFPSIVASGPNGSMPHSAPTDRQIQEGEGITIDIGARVGGYCSDMTRTIVIGKPRDPKLPELYALVLQAQEYAERNVRPGMTGREADSLAREVIERAGYGEAFTHGTGHGIGLEVHEPPWLSRVLGDDPLETGMVFSIEPGIYLPGWGGIRIEDLVVLEERGPRVLCHSTKALTL